MRRIICLSLLLAVLFVFADQGLTDRGINNWEIVRNKFLLDDQDRTTENRDQEDETNKELNEVNNAEEDKIVQNEDVIQELNIRHYDDLSKQHSAFRDIEMVEIDVTRRNSKADPCEPNDTFSTAYSIGYNDTITGCAIDPAGDLDFFRFSGTAGDTVTIDIDAYAYGSSLDSYIYLYDTDSSTVLASNDDSDGLDSRIEYYVLQSGGTFFIKVREYSHPNYGGTNYWYDISLSEGPFQPGAITGTITDQYGNPIEGIDLDIYDTNNNWVYSNDYTDSLGNYTLTDLEPGYYKVMADPGSSDPYLDEYYNNRTSLDSADLVYVSALDTTTGIDFQLEPGGAISGTITDEYGNPIEGIYLQIYDINNNSVSSYDYTDSLGNYILNQLPTGYYKVMADPGSSDPYLDEYYNNRTSLDSADLVYVSSPDTTAGIDFQLETGGSITGTVTDQYGNPIEGLDMDLYDANNNWISLSGSDDTDSLGNYILNQLPTGYYKVMADPYSSDPYLDEYYNNRASLDSADLVYVSSPDTTAGIDFQLGPGGSISGTITDEYGNPIEGIDLDIYDANNNWISLSGSDDTDSLGNYILNQLPTGYYKVMADPGSSDPYLDEYYNNRASLDSADLVYVSSPDTTAGIDFQLETAGAISGTITDEYGNPIEGIYLQIYDSNDNWVSSNDYTDSFGRYILSGLRAGNYKVKADPSTSDEYADEFYNDKGSIANADLVSVTQPDTTTGINFVLEPGVFVQGSVYDESGLPVPNTNIYVFSTASQEFIDGTVSDSTGSYNLQNLPELKIKLMAFPDYWSSSPDTIHAYEWYGNANTWDTADSIDLSTSDTIRGIDFYLEEAGHITGTVYNGDGSSVLQGADIYASMYFNDYYGWLYFFMDASDSQGNYKLYNLRTNDYRAYAYKDSFELQWYDRASDTADLDLISVTMPGTTSDIDFYLNSFYPDISISPDSMTVDLITDAVYNKSLQISNTGRDTLEFTVGDNASWLSVSPTSGIVGSQDYSTVTIEFNTAGLTAGNYSGTITVFSNDSDEPSIDISVNLNVVEAVYVYPGDTDNDGKVNASDILPIGRFWHYSGAPRDSVSTQWQAKRATPWSPEQGATYADCNGDGSVDIDDVLAIGTNWRKTHTKKAGGYVFKLAGENTHDYIDNYRDIYTSLKGNGEAVKEMKALLQGIINGSPAEYFMKNNMSENTADKAVIRFGLPEQTDVKLNVYNVTGSKIATLVNETLVAGYYSRELNTSALSSGVYLYRMETDGFISTKKIILVK